MRGRIGMLCFVSGHIAPPVNCRDVLIEFASSAELFLSLTAVVIFEPAQSKNRLLKLGREWVLFRFKKVRNRRRQEYNSDDSTLPTRWAEPRLAASIRVVA